MAISTSLYCEWQSQLRYTAGRNLNFVILRVAISTSLCCEWQSELRSTVCILPKFLQIFLGGVIKRAKFFAKIFKVIVASLILRDLQAACYLLSPAQPGGMRGTSHPSFQSTDLIKISNFGFTI